ncbi:hypothetical protein H8E77_08100 [bacterium]|nr:hypothetical protein [bacterium]
MPAHKFSIPLHAIVHPVVINYGVHLARQSMLNSASGGNTAFQETEFPDCRIGLRYRKSSSQSALLGLVEFW